MQQQLQHNRGGATAYQGWSGEHISPENYTVYISKMLIYLVKYNVLNTLDTHVGNNLAVVVFQQSQGYHVCTGSIPNI